MTGSISGVTFYNINGHYYGGANYQGYGGAIYVYSVASLTFTNIYAEQFMVMQNTPTNGGGRFLYHTASNNRAVTLTITGSTFKCYTSPFTQSSQISAVQLG